MVGSIGVGVGEGAGILVLRSRRSLLAFEMSHWGCLGYCTHRPIKLMVSIKIKTGGTFVGGVLLSGDGLRGPTDVGNVGSS